MKMISRILLTALILSAPMLTRAEDKPTEPKHFYHLLFRLQEVNEAGKVVNTRAYSTIVATHQGEGASIRTGNKIPLHTSWEKGDLTYIDVGVDIDVRNPVEDAGNLNLIVSAESSSVAAPSNGSALPNPIIRLNKWNSSVSVAIGKPTVIFSSDNLEDKGKIQLELTATPEK